MRPILVDDCGREWDEYVSSHPRATIYHLWSWRDVMGRAFGHPTFYIAARDGDSIRGVLPLVFFRRGAFGSALVSMPFVNYGGLLAETDEAEQVILEEAERLGNRLGVDYIELRHADHPQGSWPARISKVSMLLDVSGGEAAVWKSLSTKQRTRVRRASRSGFRIEEGGLELLRPYYRAFSENMRDLASPVHSSRLFRQILETFPENSRILLVRRGEGVVGGAFVVDLKGRAEVPWSSCRRPYFKLRPNEFLFWQLIRWACGRQLKVFDFGRSSPGSGTFQFKAQWGANPVGLNWQYWYRNPEVAGRLDNAQNSHPLARRLWACLPVAITRIIGPRLRRNIPL